MLFGQGEGMLKICTTHILLCTALYKLNPSGYFIQDYSKYISIQTILILSVGQKPPGNQS